ncbi:hypothetical protein PZA11_005567 [Diplocarpon coronariae]
MRFCQSAAATLALAAVSLAAADPPNRIKLFARDGTKPLVESKKLRQRITETQLLNGALDLEEIARLRKVDTRYLGTPGHTGTISYITGLLDEYKDYYTYYLQDVKVPLATKAEVLLGGEVLEASPVNLSPARNVSATIVEAENNGCFESDFPKDTKGKIVIIKTDECESYVKVHLAAKLGAVGVILYRPNLMYIHGHRLGMHEEVAGPFVPTVAVSWSTGKMLSKAMKNITASISITTEDVVTQNIIAETIQGDHDNVLLLSANTDSDQMGTGMSDNGSGVVSLLELAKHLRNYSVKNAVRFCWWTAQTQGLLGSSYYVKTASKSELEKIRFSFNLDTLASLNYAIRVYNGKINSTDPVVRGPEGSEQVALEIQRFFKEEMGVIPSMIDYESLSDNSPFLAANIPAGGITSGGRGKKTQEEYERFRGELNFFYDAGYYWMEREDDYFTLNPTPWLMITEVAAHLTATLARSFELMKAELPSNVDGAS